MPDLEPITRDEMLWSGEDVEPITRREMYIRHLYDETQVIPDRPITREEMFILKAGEELHDVTIEQLNVSENGTYSESGKAYSPVIVNVPLDSKTITSNGTYNASDDDLQGYSSVNVNVSLPSNAYLLKEVEGLPKDIATFSDGANLPMPNLKVSIEPIQSGSGDPSPSNVRPISGFTEGNVSVVGKNWFNQNYLNKYSNYSTLKSSYYYTDIIQLKPNTTYAMSPTSKDSLGNSAYYVLYINLSDSDKDYLEITVPSVKYPVSSGKPYSLSFTTGNTGVIRFGVASESALTSIMSVNWQIELGSSATSYEPYNGTTTTISWEDEVGTVYGGTLDVVSGVLTVDRVCVDMGTLDWNKANNMFNKQLPNGKEYDSTEVANMMCSNYPIVSYDDRAEKTISAYFDNIYVKDSDYETIEEFKTAMSGVQLVYELATPTTYQLSPTAVASLLGVNNVWADCGDVNELSYWSKEV